MAERKFNLTRRRVIFGLPAAALVISACGTHPETPATPNSVEQTSSPFDYCDPEQGIKADPYASTKDRVDFPEKEIYPRNANFLEEWSVSRNDIQNFKGNKDKYQVVLVPVGYEDHEIASKMSHIIKFLEIVYKDVNTEFFYVKKNAPVGISHEDRLAFLTDEEDSTLVMALVNVVALAHVPIYVFNSHQWMASGAGTVVMAGNTDRSASYLAPHELAHHFLLTDRYPRYYPPEHLADNTEIFTSTSNLRPIIQRAYTEQQPKIVQENATCNGDPVYAFSHSPNIMEGRTFKFTEEEVLQRNNAGLPILNPMQVAIINNVIERRLHK